MTYWKRRRLKKHIASINFPAYLENYGSTGEYEALVWLRAYVESRTCSEPLNVVKSFLSRSSQGMTPHDMDYLSTILAWC